MNEYFKSTDSNEYEYEIFYEFELWSEYSFEYSQFTPEKFLEMNKFTLNPHLN